jgi:hypothetical protein
MSLQKQLRKQKEILRTKKLKRYLTIETLPAKTFFKIIETKDRRYLLITKDYPDYEPPDLEALWNDIIKQYEKESGDNSNTSMVMDWNDTAQDLNDIVRLGAILLMMRMGDKAAIDELDEIGITIEDLSYESMRKVKSIIDLRQTNLEIYLMRQESKQEEKENHKFNFYRAVQRFSNMFQRNVPTDISLIEWIYLVKEAEQLQKQYKNGKAPAI